MGLELFINLNQLFHQKHTLKSLTLKNFKAKYVGSFMSIAWTVITPLLMAGVITIIFTKILKVQIVHFPLFILSGYLPWMFFSKALSEGTNSIIQNVNLLNQFKFSREIIPLSVVFANFLSFLLGFIVILPLFIIFNHRVILYIWFLPVILIFFLLFTCGICLFLASINVLIRDVAHIVEIGLLFWFWLTPIFYSIKMVPESYRMICYLNPLTIFIIMFKDVLYRAILPDVWIIAIGGISAFTIGILGYMVFKKLSPIFLKRI